MPGCRRAPHTGYAAPQSGGSGSDAVPTPSAPPTDMATHVRTRRAMVAPPIACIRIPRLPCRAYDSRLFLARTCWLQSQEPIEREDSTAAGEEEEEDRSPGQ